MPKCSECGQTHMAGANGAIYCCGPLLRSVQLSGMYNDSKYFVDMSCRYSPERILADYQLFSSCKKNETSIKHLTNFVENHFDQPGTELDYWCPPDYRCEPSFVGKIKDPELKKFALDLNRIWKQLGRVMKDCVRSSAPMYSLVYVPNPFIVPGGRFIEFYYWDTYWIVRGLLFSGMHQTARGMIDNLLYLVKKFQMVPSGNRVYYWSRSQPPMLVHIVKSYVEFTRDENYAIQNLPLLESEMDNFLKDHAVQVEGRTMYVYRDKSGGPRPEAYREDEAIAEGFCSAEEKEEHFAHVKAACESGQAFSSRWFISPSGNNVGTLANIKTGWIVPVELNCILFRGCKILTEFSVKAGNQEKAQKFRNHACGLIKAITTILWNEERGVWLDYDLKNRKQRDFFAVTNLSPLWMHAYPINDSEKISQSVLDYIEDNRLDSFPGGVPHTLSNTGQLWDYPNVFPPMMLMLIEGLNNLGTPEAIEMSKRWRSRWVTSNYECYVKTNFMYEKYNCEVSGTSDVPPGADQTGYGWTNGVLIELLARYGDEIELCAESEDDQCDCQDNASTGLQDCPITSDAYLQKAADDAYAKMCCEMTESEPNNDEECLCGEGYSTVIESFATSEKSGPCLGEAENEAQQPCPPPCPNVQSAYSSNTQGSKAPQQQQKGMQQEESDGCCCGPPTPNAKPGAQSNNNYADLQPNIPCSQPRQQQKKNGVCNESPSNQPCETCYRQSGANPPCKKPGEQVGNAPCPPGVASQQQQRDNYPCPPGVASQQQQRGNSPCPPGVASQQQQQRGNSPCPPGGASQQQQQRGNSPCPPGGASQQQQQRGNSPCPPGSASQQQQQSGNSSCPPGGSSKQQQEQQQIGVRQKTFVAPLRGPPCLPPPNNNSEPQPESCSCRTKAKPVKVEPPKPIQIELTEVNCIEDLDAPQQKKNENCCPCDSDAEMGNVVESRNCDDGNTEPEDDESVYSEPAPKPIAANKLYPLADDRGCDLNRKPPEIEEEELCECEKKFRENAQKRDSAQE